MNKLSRLLKHIWAERSALEKAFTHEQLEKVTQVIQHHEQQHGAQVVVVIENALEPHEILKGKSGKERAIEVFAEHRVWDTEKNCGALLYLLLADRDLEIVVDRGVSAKISNQTWEQICRQIEEDFKLGDFYTGVVRGIEQISNELKTHFPYVAGQKNELSDKPQIV